MSLRFTPRAAADLADILGGLQAQAGTEAAQRWRARFTRVFTRLAEWPTSGAVRADLCEGRRIAPVAPFVIVYRAEGNDAVVIRILHGARDLPDVLGGEET